jgi:predicted AlkP superfamily phosphohydrolase/phosphomutase
MSPSDRVGEEVSNPKVLVIGLDGATFDLLDPMMKEGRLPNLSNLIEEGSRGILESTIPPVTIPAWVSMLTGKNPGKLGCFDLLKQVGYLSEPNSICYEGKTPLWRILNNYGIRTGLMNIPGTYPPEPVDGFMITGMLTPSKNSEYSYPSQLAEDLDRRIDPYEIDVPQWQYFDRDRFIKDLYKVTEKREAAVEYLTETINCDFYMIVFTSSDRLHHVLWKEKEIVESYWEDFDFTLGRLIKRFNDHTILLVSDHGFGSLKNTFYVNEWLKGKGYLKVKEDNGASLLVKLGGWIERFYRWIGKKVPFIDSLLGYFQELIGQDRIQKAAYNYISSSKLEGIIWESTRAFAGVHSPHFGQIYLNLEGKMENGILPKDEREEIREALIRDLTELKGLDGKRIKVEVFKPEDIYVGEKVDGAPDIIFILEDGTIEIDAKVGVKKIFEEGSPFTGWTGTHTRKGIFIIKGHNIKSGLDLGRISIMDVTPTILKIYGIPRPEEMDGKAVPNIFEIEPLDERDLQNMDEDIKEIGLTIEEKKLIEERLRSLGYIT